VTHYFKQDTNTKHMKRPLFLIATSLMLASCNNLETNKMEREDQPSIYTVDDSNADMNAAIKTANQTLDKFNESLNSKNPDFEYFSLKTKFKTPNGGEHIWVSNITIKDNKYFGVVDNLPEATTDVKIGDNIEIDKNNISDWMYLEKGKLRGGYTIKLLRNRMGVEERKQFDEGSGLIIED
jgi:uncharacterized protein YegJ (DUF2314 family)